MLGVVASALLVDGCGGGSKSGSTQSSAANDATKTTPVTQSSAQPTTTTTQPSTTASTASTASAPTKAPERAPPNERIEITSRAIKAGVLPTRYTCSGSDTPPPLHWKGVPPGTAELMLDIIKIKPVNNKLFFPWAVTHIPPTVHSIGPGKLPAGAVVGTNGDGQAKYHLCPPKGPTEAYVAVLFSLPHKLAAKQGFDPMALRREAENTATYQDLYIFNYTRH